MAFDIKSAIPIRERFVSLSKDFTQTENSEMALVGEQKQSLEQSSVSEPSIGFDISSAKPVSGIKQAVFKTLDSSNFFIEQSKNFFRGIERGFAGFGSGLEFFGKDIVVKTKAEDFSVAPFPYDRIPWLRINRQEPNKIGQAIEGFFLRSGDTLAEIGKTAKDFYNDKANKGVEAPNPAILFGWKRPFRKTASLAVENLPMLGVAALVTAATKSPIAGAATFFPAIAGDMYEDAVANGVAPMKAADMAYLTGAVQTALETIPLSGWMKGGSLLKRVLRTSLQEGLIGEGTQQLFDNGLRIIGWDEPRPIWDRLTDGLAESILAGAVSGGVLGSFQAPDINDVRYDIHQEVINEGMKQGLTEEQISQTLDKVDEVIDKTIGIELPINPPKTAVSGDLEVGLAEVSEITPDKLEQVYQEAGIEVVKIIKSKLGGWYVYHPFAMEETTYKYERKLVKEEGGTKTYERTKTPIKLKRDFISNEEDALELLKMNLVEARIRGDLKKVDVDEIVNKIFPQKGNAFAMSESGETVSGGKLGVFGKTIPEVKEKIAWEQNKAWQVNLGRDIAGIFEKHIGPELQVSTRMKKWLGVYYPTLGENGLIRVRSLSQERTLFHETGHFLDDALGDVKISRTKVIRNELKSVSQWQRPWNPLTASTSEKSYRNSKEELFADYVAAYVLDKERTRQLSPLFTAQIENTIGKDREWNYIIDKLHQFEEAMKPLKDYVNALRKIPEIQPWLKEWAEKGNLLQQLWRNKVGDKVWDVYSKAIENLGKKIGVKSFFEKGGLNDTIFEILRQRRKLIQGQQQRVREELIEPVSELNKEEQQYVAESLQRFGETMQDTELDKLTEAARKELAVWGNEARKLGLLNDEVFWNNVGQYFPFFYETKEFEKNKRNFGYFPSKAIRARFESLKHKLTDEEFGRKVLEAQYGTWPSGKQKIAQYDKEELISIGQNAREELGLIKTAAYPLQKRIFGMIEMVYTVKAFNTVATIPGIIGHKGVEGFDKMPEGKKYGAMSGAYAPVDLVKEVSKWNAMRSELGEVWRNVNSIWKMFKVPYNPAAVSRNLITNAIISYFGDVPIYNPVVASKGIKSFIKHDEAYQILRDRGLYHNTYSEQEMKELAFHIEEDKSNPQTQILKWANKITEGLQVPARLYGAVEDTSKTIIARYVLDNGGTPEQAVQFADKLLFDYSQTSEAVGYARQAFFPFITWSAKILPRLVEFSIRKPEKFILILSAISIFNALSRSLLGIDREDEERLKPDYIRGKSVLLMPGRNINGDLEWIDLTYFLPWGGWMPIEKGKLAIPQTLTMSNPLLTLYNAYVLNYDPFYGEIAPKYLNDDDQAIEKGKYVAKSLLPQILMLTPGKLINANKKDRYGREKEIGKILSGEFLGIKFVADTSAFRKKIQKGIEFDFYKGRARVNRQLQAGEITKEQAKEKIIKLKKKQIKEKKEH